MNLEYTYKLLNLIILLPWILMIVFPQKAFTRKLINGAFFPMFMAIAYTLLFVIFMGKGEGGMSSLADLRLAFDHSGILLLAWVHYLAFDLLVGSWIFFDAQQKGIAHAWLIPCLILTLMAGPVGFLLYYILRGIKVKTWNLK